MNVLTNEEFSIIVNVVRSTTLKCVKTYVRNIDLGKPFKTKKLNSLRMICYIRNLLVNTWEQSAFTNEEYSNFMSDVDVRNLYAKLLKLSKNV